MEKGHGVARVEARRVAGGAIDITTKNVRRLRLLLPPTLIPEGRELVVRLDGREAFRGVISADCDLYARTLTAASDPGQAYAAVVELTVVR
jgi:hypothetical protein